MPQFQRSEAIADVVTHENFNLVTALARKALLWDTRGWREHPLGSGAMNELSHEQKSAEALSQGRVLDWRKSMSDHVAYALLVYTGLQIFVTIKALAQGFSSILPYVALVILVAAIIPACRWFERRWTLLGDEAASDPALQGDFRRDTIALWLLAIGLPFLLTGLVKAIFAIL
jgi:hypothetical protein